MEANPGSPFPENRGIGLLDCSKPQKQLLEEISKGAKHSGQTGHRVQRRGSAKNNCAVNHVFTPHQKSKGWDKFPEQSFVSWEPTRKCCGDVYRACGTETGCTSPNNHQQDPSGGLTLKQRSPNDESGGRAVRRAFRASFRAPDNVPSGRGYRWQARTSRDCYKSVTNFTHKLGHACNYSPVVA